MTVETLKSDVKRLNETKRERIIRLEASGDLIAEKAKNAAMAGAQVMTAHPTKELYETKAELAQWKGRPLEALSIQIGSDTDEKGKAGAERVQPRPQ
jgi:hypothetical protein